MPKAKKSVRASTSTCNVSPLHVVNTLKRMGATKDKIKSVRTKSDMCHHITQALSLKCLRNWTFKAFLGAGSYGTIFTVRSKKGAVRAAKIVGVDPTPEVRAHRRLADLGVAPKLYDSCKLTDGVWVLIMEKLDGSVQDLVGGEKSLSLKKLNNIVREVVFLAEIMEEADVCHGDLSLDNVGYVTRPDGSLRLLLIDFGWSGRHVPMFDMTSLVQSLLFTKNEVNRNYLYDSLHDYILKKYDVRIPESTDDLDAFFGDMQKEFIAKLTRL